MSRLGQTWRKLQFLLRRPALERDLAEEMRLHAELKTLHNAGEGMPIEAARAAACRQLGNITQQREESRQSWGFPTLESIVQDIRYGVRGLRNSPGFSLVAIITLSLGIGATTAIFSVVNSVLLRPLPYKDSARLVNIWTVTPLFPGFEMGQSIPNLNDIRSRAHSFDIIAAVQSGEVALTGAGAPERLTSASVTADFLSVFSIQPVLGREMNSEDEQGKNGNVVWLSYGMWQRRFAGDRAIVGKTISLDQNPYVIAGVLPSSFNFRFTEIWKPLVLTAEARSKRENWLYSGFARLRPGVSRDQAQAELNGIAAQIEHDNPKDAEGLHFSLAFMQYAAVAKSSRSLLLMLLAAVSFLLLIACANVSNLILSRGIQRQREIAVRAALGASRLRILRQLLIESVILSLAGGFCGLAVAVAGVSAFRWFAPQNFARLNEVGVSPVMTAIAFLIACISGIVCGLAPAMHVSRTDLNLVIREHSKSPADKGPFSLRNILAVTEVALALVLLTGAALMAQSIVRQLRVDTGFRTHNLITAKLQLDPANYADEAAERIFISKLLTALRAQPGLTSVGISNAGLMEGSSLMSFDPGTLGLAEKTTAIQVRSVTPGFFETLGIHLLSGRLFSARDVKGAPMTIVINQAMYKRFLADKDPIGRILKLWPGPDGEYQIVGIVADTRDIRPSKQAGPQIYMSLLQDPMRSLYLVARSQTDTATLTPLIENSVWSVDKNLPLKQVKTMTEVLSATVAEPRFHTWLLIAFAVVGLVLTLVGIYGVISYSVSRRTHEIGIRMALGAKPQSVLRMVLKRGATLAVMGSILGLLGSLALMRFLGSQLYDIKPGDPATLVGAALLMLAVALAASYIPARRATRVDPMVALRYE
jgi:predicted permease